jgi:mannitol/fructose-specific phosphotransferase system IIA component (Ntr-type)
VEILGELAQILLDPGQAEQLRSATRAEQVLSLLAPVGGTS